MKLLRHAFVAALLACAAARYTADIFVPDICSMLSSDSWLYKLYGCDKDSAGGGAGGAS